MPIAVQSVVWEPNGEFPSVGYSSIRILEGECISVGTMFLRAKIVYADPLTPANYANTYEIVDGELPRGLEINSSGYFYGYILPARPPEPYDQTNYGSLNTGGYYKRFTVRARWGVNQTATRPFSIAVEANWSSRRDDFILNIKNQYPLGDSMPTDLEYQNGKGRTFFLDGKPTDNETYLKTMKSRGYFPGPGSC